MAPWDGHSTMAHIPTVTHPHRFVDVCDDFGFTPLMYAVIGKQPDAVTLLLSYDANIITRSALVHPGFDHWPSGVSALHMAAWDGSSHIVKLMLRVYVSRGARCRWSQRHLEPNRVCCVC